MAFPDVVLGVGLPPWGRPVGDSGQERPALSASGQNLAPTSRDLEVVGMADHRPPFALDLSDGVRAYSISFWLERLLPPIRVVAAFADQRESDDVPLGRHRLVSSFMRGAKRLRPVRPSSIPSWHLSVVLKGLLEPPFEPLESAPLRILTLKFTLLLALASFKHVGDLQTLSVSESWTKFAPG